jgi:primase-polymerase (primpol)-like protein
MLGGIQSLKDGLNDDAPSANIYDTDVIEFPMSSSSAYTAYANTPTIENEIPAEWLSESPTSSMEKFETQSKERGERYVLILFLF